MNRDSFNRNQENSTRPLGESEAAGTPPMRGDAFSRQSEGPPKTSIRPPTAPMRGLGGGTRPLGAPPAGPSRLGRTDQIGAPRSATRPLGSGGVPVDALKTLTEQTLAKAEALTNSLEPRVELLLQAFMANDMPVPGVAHMPIKHKLTANTQKIVTYLARALKLKPDLARQMAIAIFRYHEASGMLARTREALAIDEVVPALLEELKLKFFYLTNYHEEFKGDPILTQLFPPPKGGGTTANLQRPNTAGLSPADKIQTQQKRLQTLNRAQALLARLQARMAPLRLALEMKDATTARRLGALLKPAERTASLLAKHFKQDPAIQEQVQRALSTFEQFQAELAKVQQGAEPESLSAYIEALEQMHEAWRSHPVLGAVLAPAGTRDIGPG